MHIHVTTKAFPLATTSSLPAPDLLCCPAAQHCTDAVQQLLLGEQHTLVGQVLGEPQDASAARDNGHLCVAGQSGQINCPAR